MNFLKKIKGETKVLAAIKAELDTPDILTPNLGKLDFFVDWYFILNIFNIFKFYGHFEVI